MHANKKIFILMAALVMIMLLTIALPCLAQLAAVDLHPTDASVSRAWSINSKGEVAGTITYFEFNRRGKIESSYTRAVVWVSDGMIVLDPTGAFGNTEAMGINDNGQVMGRIGDGEGAFIWDSTNGMVRIPKLTYPGTNQGAEVDDFDIYPQEINEDGWIIGSSGYSIPGYSVYRSWIYRNNTIEQIKDADGKRIAAMAINDSGQVAGSYSDPLYDEYDREYHPAVIWEKPIGAASPTVTILTPEGMYASAHDINNSGQAVVYQGYYDDAFIWSEGVLTPLMLGGDGYQIPDTEDW
ncbi:MAG: hypothetical protein ACYC0V_20035, partial [Armatimonadota bacterium]